MAADADAKQPLKFCTRIPSIEMVPVPMREDTTEIAQPLDRAWNKLK
jgi:hypothetical protein